MRAKHFVVLVTVGLLLAFGVSGVILAEEYNFFQMKYKFLLSAKGVNRTFLITFSKFLPVLAIKSAYYSLIILFVVFYLDRFLIGLYNNDSYN